MLDSFRRLFGQGQEAGGYAITGRKPTQQDAWYISPKNALGQLVLVADGVGGHAHGEFASQLCVDVFKASFEATHTRIADISAYLKLKAIHIAEQVWAKSQSEPEYRNCGTTLSAFLLKEDAFYLLHIGDSRIYLLDRSDNLHLLTRDQTVVQRLLEAGELSPAEALTHPQKNVMYSAIGQEPSNIQIDIRGPETIAVGEMLFTFSDGIHDALSDQEISKLITNHKKDRNLAEILVQAAYDAGGQDNITACWYRH